MIMKNSLPLNECHVKKTDLILNRLHTFLHGIALLALLDYRITNFLHKNTPFLPYSPVFISELVLSFLWLLSQPSKWKPVVRKVFPERLPKDENLPSIDVFICTADPSKEPSVEVMNTVISSMALDYPKGKLHVYLSDDGGSQVTLRAVREAWKFAKCWIPFCRKYEVKNRCPEVYFVRDDNYCGGFSSNIEQFEDEKKIIERKYEEFKDCLVNIVENTSTSVSKDHSSIIEVINDSLDPSNEDEIPLLVYVAREKRPSQSHNFKAGSLNVLLRVSAMIINSPFILVLDCDMYCNDPSSARQAMCFHLDPKLSTNLALVQFPQKFHNISNSDIIDGQLRVYWRKWEGFDGLMGPPLSGTGFYIKRKALYGTSKVQEDDGDLVQLKRSFGSSNEFIKSIFRNYEPNFLREEKLSRALVKEVQRLASCMYDNGTKWGKEVGFRYFCLVEDYFTGFNLHCEGWISVYIDPSRPCFLGASPVSLNDSLTQYTRWHVGLMQVALSRYSPLFYGPLRMSTLQSMGYAELAFNVMNFIPLYCLSIVPQLCLLCGVPLYPKVSNPFFLVFLFVFLSSQIKHVQEISSAGRHSIKTWAIEQRIWMMRSATSFFYATLNTILEKFGFAKTDFLPTNKVIDDFDQAKRYEMGIYDFQASSLFMAPLCSLYILSMASFVIGFVEILNTRKWDEMLVQAFIPFFGVVVNYPLFEGMVLRKDKGRVVSSISLISAAISSIILYFCMFFVT